MNLFTFYTDKVIETMENDHKSIYNKVQLRFIGRHILSIRDAVNLYSNATISIVILFNVWKRWRIDLRITHY